ncbi:MAG: D-tyrosyl-tRNA(Tyr) deacylase [Clostridia bacterium]|nr:D-tyrosyl-tRNA(Tyr) deacylase [Clostridia bacterium]
MIALLQRVTESSVSVDGNIIGRCGKGLMILLGVLEGDSESDAVALAEKIHKLRIFEDENGKMNRSVCDVGGGALVISQFTLAANYAHGNRPDFLSAAKPDIAKPLYEFFADELQKRISGTVERGEFGADMKVSLINDGPVTIIMDSKVLLKK